jgi:hypothetical protein
MWSQTDKSNLLYKSSNQITRHTLANGHQQGIPQDSSLATLVSPELQDVISFSGDAFPFSALLGRCDDGPSLLLDLSNPETGSMLIIGGRRCGKTQLLRTIALSACQLNPPERVSFYIFTCHSNQWSDMVLRRQCLRLHHPESLSANRSISNLTEYAFRRRSARLHSPVLILFIDDLDRLLVNRPDHEFLADLYRLVKFGPQSKIWTIAAMDSAKLASLPPELASCFTTLIIGKFLPNQLDAFSSSLECINTPSPLPPGGFIACFHQVQIRFRTLLG